jgi:CheY-like chemotaxis protein
MADISAMLSGESPAPILLAEDEENDIVFMQLAFKKAGLQNRLISVSDGEEAIDYLEGRGAFSDRDRFPLPCLLLTDLKMPRVNGFELLTWLRDQAQLTHIPVIVLSSSSHEEDEKRSYDLGAKAYWVKPSQIQVLIELVKGMRDTWVSAHCA